MENIVHKSIDMNDYHSYKTPWMEHKGITFINMLEKRAA